MGSSPKTRPLLCEIMYCNFPLRKYLRNSSIGEPTQGSYTTLEFIWIYQTIRMRHWVYPIQTMCGRLLIYVGKKNKKKYCILKIKCFFAWHHGFSHPNLRYQNNCLRCHDFLSTEKSPRHHDMLDFTIGESGVRNTIHPAPKNRRNC